MTEKLEPKACPTSIPTSAEMDAALEVSLEQIFAFNREILAMGEDARRIRAKSLVREAMTLDAQLRSLGRSRALSVGQEFLQHVTESAIDSADPADVLEMLPFMYRVVLSKRQVLKVVIKRQEQEDEV